MCLSECAFVGMYILSAGQAAILYDRNLLFDSTHSLFNPVLSYLPCLHSSLISNILYHFQWLLPCLLAEGQ